MKLIIGLGNPGDKYKHTRHNAGFLALDEVAKVFQFDEFKKVAKHKSLIAEGKIGDEKVLLVKPTTFMNLSGQAVQSLMSFYKMSLTDLVVIYDEVALPSGVLRVRPSGSAAGHNGVKSIISLVGDQFTRIRLGIQPLFAFKGDLADYVLGQLSFDEKELLNQNIQKLPKLLELLFAEGVEEVMQKFN